jgi:hypothetical protein
MDAVSIGIRSTDAGFLEKLRPYLTRFAVENAPERYVMLSADCGAVTTLVGGKILRGRATLYVNQLVVYRGFSVEEMIGRFLSVIRDMSNDESNEFIRVRGAGVVLGDGAVVLPSLPDPHLPALSGLLVEAGARYLGDEIVNVDPVTAKAYGRHFPLLVDASDTALFPALGTRYTPRRRAAGVPSRRLALAVEELGGAVAPPTEIRRLVFPSFEPGRPTELRPIAKAEAVFAIASAVLNMHVWGERALIMANRLLGSATAARLTVGSLPDAASTIMHELQGTN